MTNLKDPGDAFTQVLHSMGYLREHRNQCNIFDSNMFHHGLNIINCWIENTVQYSKCAECLLYKELGNKWLDLGKNIFLEK